PNSWITCPVVKPNLVPAPAPALPATCVLPFSGRLAAARARPPGDPAAACVPNLTVVRARGASAQHGPDLPGYGLSAGSQRAGRAKARLRVGQGLTMVIP